MKPIFYLSLLLFFSHFTFLQAQSVTIDPSAAGGSNIIQANSPDKALKLPSVAGTSNIGSPQAGQLIYNQSTASPSYYNGSSWQNVVSSPVPSNIFHNSKHFGDPGNSIYNGSSLDYDTYTWICPAGVSRIWAEMWSGGTAGDKFPASPNAVQVNQIYGGRSGSFASVIFSVIPGQTYTINVGKGGLNTYGGSSSFNLIPTAIFSFGNGGFGSVNFDFQLLAYRTANLGKNCKFDFRT